ncbi:hypothetical protein ES706_04907 [subsurface metagenome]
MRDFQVAIHGQEGNFSERWIEYCDEKGIPYKVVNCYESDIMSQLLSADALLWHWLHTTPEAVLIARHVIRAAELMGLKVFPNTNTCWSYDDKVAQKYLLEAIGAPLVPTYVFYNRHRALNWIKQISFPKVFKLRRGAGSRNVRLVRNAREACALVKQAFGRGFKPMASRTRELVAKLRTHSGRKSLDLLGKIGRFPQTALKIYRINKYLGREKGYVYFQDFVPDNQLDTRITVIGNRAFGFTRNVRERDFRASGSGSIDYSLNRINPESVHIAFDVARKLGAQSIAFDFVMSAEAEPKITEVSYCYVAEAVHRCEGYWDERLIWHEGHMWPQDAILIDLLEQLSRDQKT